MTEAQEVYVKYRFERARSSERGHDFMGNGALQYIR